MSSQTAKTSATPITIRWTYNALANRDDLARRARAAGFVDVQFRTVFTISKTHDSGTQDYPVFLMHARRAAA